MKSNATVKDLYKLITSARRCVALTGAGVSTLSGIRDFRGKGGLYTLSNGAYQRMFDIDEFERDPSAYYQAAKDFIYGLDDKEASIVHTTLGKMETRGLVQAIITQNIDFLHQRGGAKHVIEVHGSPAWHYCMRCAGVRVPFAEVQAVVKQEAPEGSREGAVSMPRCPKCGRVLKPAITFFGEMLPAAALREAEEEAQAADLMLVLGTSLTVYPAAGLPNTTLRAGGKIVIVNEQPTSLDGEATMRFEQLEATFEELNSLLDGG
jgi:NAD-dependent deacetylase